MANPFGAIVDDDMLNDMEKYIGKKITQEDRAREAINLKNDDGKNSKAQEYVESVKAFYGDGISTLCLIYNATGDTLYYVTDNDWYGFIGRTPYPTQIGNGQWVGFLHVHTTSASSGSEAAVVYRGKNKDGDLRDFLFAWSTPWSSFYRNKAFCDVRSVDQFEGSWDDIYGNVNNGDYQKTVDWDGIYIHAATATGSSPVYTAMIQYPV